MQGAEPPIPVETLLPTAKPTVICKEIAEGAVMFAQESEMYFGLNRVGTQAWHLLAPKLRTVEELVAHLSKQYPDVPVEVIREDAIELLDELARNGLVEPTAHHAR